LPQTQRVNSKSGYRNAVDVPLSLLLNYARSGTIKRALINNTTCMFELHGDENTRWNKVSIPSSIIESKIVSLLMNASHGDPCEIGPIPSSAIERWSNPLLLISPFLYLGMVYKVMKNLHSTESLASSGTNDTLIPKTRFSDVAGIDRAKSELVDIIDFLRNPQRYKAIGARPPKGILLYGPSGTGKTLLARAVAGEASVSESCACVFLSSTASDFVEMLVGRGAARIRDLFDRARSEARKEQRRRAGLTYFNNPIRRLLSSSTPSHEPSGGATAIIFIDEIDALAKRRGGINSSDEREQTLNQLLTEMDGFDSSSASEDENDVTIIVMASTNRPEILDLALLRPGRFDRHVLVGPPENSAARESILCVHARNILLYKPSDINDGDDAVNLTEIASSKYTMDFTGSELANLVNESALLAIRDGCVQVKQSHLILAAERVTAMKKRH